MSIFKDMLGNSVRAGDLVRIHLQSTEETARVAEVSGGLIDTNGKEMPVTVQVLIPIAFRLDPKNPIAPVFKLANPENERLTEALLDSTRRAS